LSASTLAVAVAFGGPSPEHDVSILTGLQAVRELERAGRSVTPLYWAKTGTWHQVDGTLESADFVDGVPRGAEALRLVVGAAEDEGFVTAGRFGRARPLALDVLVNCCHGGPGEDGSLQAALDLAHVTYTGPTVAGAALGMDKLAFAGVVSDAGLPALDRVELTAATTDVGFAGPYLVKPRFGGSSLGIESVVDLDTATRRLDVNPHLRQGAVVEPFRPDLFDLNVAVRRWPDLQLSAVERPLRTSAGSEILGYADKYVGGEGMAGAPRQLPAEIPPSLAEAVRVAATRVAGLCQARGVARVDFLSDGEVLYVNEINTIPGSLARYLWVDPDVPFLAQLDVLIDEAVARPAYFRSTVGADGAVLRSAGSIASKLA
jgi:D-alanine-D-alanine ligase